MVAVVVGSPKVNLRPALLRFTIFLNILLGPLDEIKLGVVLKFLLLFFLNLGLRLNETKDLKVEHLEVREPDHRALS